MFGGIVGEEVMTQSGQRLVIEIGVRIGGGIDEGASQRLER